MIDIRPLTVKQKNLSFIKGNILKIPFKDGEINSLSSLCVIEHIGLGRYGDKLDSFGSEKSTKELKRVLSEDGKLYISVPVDSENKIFFNAHRAFTREYIIKLFEPLKLIEEKYIYGNKVEDFYDKSKGFGTGLFYFNK
jgi:ubiquinone/menaquinone biosynthesis C-methylase UbiE